MLLLLPLLSSDHDSVEEAIDDQHQWWSVVAHDGIKKRVSSFAAPWNFETASIVA